MTSSLNPMSVLANNGNYKVLYVQNNPFNTINMFFPLKMFTIWEKVENAKI